MTLRALLDDREKLKTELEATPALVNKQDEMGMTLLHHAAQLGQIMGRTSLSSIFEILFATPGLDFNIKDSRGNTPVHVAAWCSRDRVTCTYVLPIFVQKAMECGFDFTTLGEAGQSVLHIAARTSYRGVDSVKTLLEHPIDLSFFFSKKDSRQQSVTAASSSEVIIDRSMSPS